MSINITQMKRYGKVLLFFIIFMFGMFMYLFDPYWQHDEDNKKYKHLPVTVATMEKLEYSRTEGIQVIASFTIDGEKHIAILDRQTRDFSPGDKFEIFYNANNLEYVYFKYPYADELNTIGIIGKNIMIISGCLMITLLFLEIIDGMKIERANYLTSRKKVSVKFVEENEDAEDTNNKNNEDPIEYK